MSNLVDHAKRELALINEDPEFKEAYLKICEIFASMGHSGGSASVAIPVITALLSQENLSPLTDNPAEWEFHGPEIWPPDGIWQNNRYGQAFSHDRGKTFWLLSDKDKGDDTVHTSRAWAEVVG